MPEPQPVIRVRGLRHSYGDRQVLLGVDLDVHAGEIVALLGRNGAGKTTFVECLEGFRTPQQGELRLLGLDPRRQRSALMPALGVMLQEGGANPGSSPREVLRLHAALRADPTDVDGLLEQVGLRGAARQRVRTLSGGQKQRLNLAVALVGRPLLLLLDEPTSGMDAEARRATWTSLRRYAADGGTVLFSTHAMDEAERLADRVAVLEAGRILAVDRPGALAAQLAGPQLVVTTPAVVDADALAADVGALVHQHGEGRIVLRASADAVPVVAAWFAERGLPLHGVNVGGGLEDALLALGDPVGE